MEKKYCVWPQCEKLARVCCVCNLLLCQKHGAKHAETVLSLYGLDHVLLPLQAASTGGNR